MSIYFAQPLAGGPIKIGCSDDVPRRLRQLEAHYGQPLALLATMSGGRDEEQAIHARFAHLRLGRTEQFRPATDLMTFIGRPLLVGANPEAVEAIASPERDTRSQIVAVRCRATWEDWVLGLAAHCREDTSDLVDHALVEYARIKGYQVPPPKR